MSTLWGRGRSAQDVGADGTRKLKWTPWCECGNPRVQDAEGCERCCFLDGGSAGRLWQKRTPLRALVISTLRGTDGMTITELASALGGHTTNVRRERPLLYRSLHRIVTELMASGRLRRYEQEQSRTRVRMIANRLPDGRVVSFRRATDDEDGFEFQSAGGIAWVYALNGRTKR